MYIRLVIVCITSLQDGHSVIIVTRRSPHTTGTSGKRYVINMSSASLSNYLLTRIIHNVQATGMLAIWYGWNAVLRIGWGGGVWRKRDSCTFMQLVIFLVACFRYCGWGNYSPTALVTSPSRTTYFILCIIQVCRFLVLQCLQKRTSPLTNKYWVHWSRLK